MDTSLVPKVAEIIGDAAKPLGEAAARIKAGATLSEEAARLLGRETIAATDAVKPAEFNLADPRTYSARFTSPLDPDHRRVYKSVEAIAAIVRNSSRTDAKTV